MAFAALILVVAPGAAGSAAIQDSGYPLSTPSRAYGGSNAISTS